MPPVKVIAEYVLLLIAVVGLVGGIYNRMKLKLGIGVRFIQYLGLTILLPIIAVLALEERISQEITGAIAAAAVGGVLAGIGKEDSK